MKRKLIFLINPISGTSKKDRIRQQIDAVCREYAIEFELLNTVADGNYEFLKQKIQQEGITDIVVCGGDGSVSSIAGALLNVPVNIGIIPMGSGNGLARAAAIPMTTTEALKVIMQGYTEPVDGFFINGKFSCMLAGIGFDAQVAHDFSHQKTRGLTTYIKLSAINFLKAHPYQFRIHSDDSLIDTRAYFISIANSNQFGNNFTIAPRASLKDGLLDIVIVKDMPKLILPFSILYQVTGINTLKKIDELLESANIFYFQAASLEIDNAEGALLHVDGDPCPSADVFSIKVLPGAFRLIQPQPAAAIV